jgi:hypothetical protein
VAVVSLGAPPRALADSFSVDQWGLTISVDSAWPDVAAATFHTVLNPFLNQHSVTLPSNPATSAAAQYDISWLVNYGSFNISAQLAAQDGNSVRSLASGTVYLQADADLTLNLDSILNYNLPTGLLGAFLSFDVRDQTAGQYLLTRSAWYITYPDPTGPGTLSCTGDAALPAGHEFRVQYQMSLQTSGASSGLATADGFVNFTLEPLPEPASLALLTPLLLALRRRRVHWAVGGWRAQAA